MPPGIIYLKGRRLALILFGQGAAPFLPPSMLTLPNSKLPSKLTIGNLQVTGPEGKVCFCKSWARGKVSL